MGINAVRVDASGNEAALFTALLDLGMEVEATDMLERYLRRLRLIDARSATGYKFRAFYMERMGGVVDPVGGALHDAIAVALARLSRPEDYRHVLIRRAILERGTPPQHDTRLSFLSRPGGTIIYSSRGSTVRLTLEITPVPCPCRIRSRISTCISIFTWKYTPGSEMLTNLTVKTTSLKSVC